MFEKSNKTKIQKFKKSKSQKVKTCLTFWLFAKSFTRKVETFLTFLAFCEKFHPKSRNLFDFYFLWLFAKSFTRKVESRKVKTFLIFWPVAKSRKSTTFWFFILRKVEKSKSSHSRRFLLEKSKKRKNRKIRKVEKSKTFWLFDFLQKVLQFSRCAISGERSA